MEQFAHIFRKEAVDKYGEFYGLILRSKRTWIFSDSFSIMLSFDLGSSRSARIMSSSVSSVLLTAAL